MKRNIIAALIFILLISTSFTGAFAEELFTDFDEANESLDSTVWTEDLSEFSSTSTINAENGRYSVSGNITKNKTISLQANISATKNNDILRIEYDVNPNIKINKGEQRSYLKIGSNEYLLVRFRRVSVDNVSAAGYNIYFSTVGDPVVPSDPTGGKTGKWYRIATEFNKLTEMISISIKDYSADTILASQQIPFETFFGDAAAEYKSSGFDTLELRAIADKDKDTAVGITYRMVKIASVPYVKELALKDIQTDTEVGEIVYVGQQIRADAVLNDDTAEAEVAWYCVGEDADEKISSDAAYTITSADVGKQIYAKVTPKDSDTIGVAVKSDDVNVALFKAHQNTDITKETIEFFTLVDTDTLTPENVTLTPGNIKPISITTEDEKVFTLNFEEGALEYNTEYTISITGAAFENTDACTGTASFITRLAPGIVLTKTSGKTEAGIYFLSEIKLSTNENAEALYEEMNVYAQLVRDGNVIRTNSFVIDIEKGNEYVLKTAFFNPLESDSIRWICEKDSAEISNTLTLVCKEEE